MFLNDDTKSAHPELSEIHQVLQDIKSNTHQLSYDESNIQIKYLKKVIINKLNYFKSDNVDILIQLAKEIYEITEVINESNFKGSKVVLCNLLKENIEGKLFSIVIPIFSNITQHRIQNKVKDFEEILKDTEDIVQDAMIKIFQKYLHDWNSAGKFMEYKVGFVPWALQILHFTIGDYYKKRNRQKNVFSINSSEELINIADERVERKDESDVETELTEVERMIRDIIDDNIEDYTFIAYDECVFKSLRKMNPRCQFLFTQLVNPDLDVEEICEKIDEYDKGRDKFNKVLTKQKLYELSNYCRKRFEEILEEENCIKRRVQGKGDEKKIIYVKGEGR